MKQVSIPKLFIAGVIDPSKSPFVSISLEKLGGAIDAARVKAGDEIVLLDLTGKGYCAVVAECTEESVVFHITREAAKGEMTRGIEPESRLYLLFGALRGGLTETVVRKATELGATEIGIFRSDYGLSRLNARDLERLNSCAEDAARGCLRSFSPSVSYFDDFRSALVSASGYGTRLIFSESGGRPQSNMSALSGDCVVVVGPEGGFSPNELNSARASGFLSATLGRHVLDADTAAVSALTLVAYFTGGMK